MHRRRTLIGALTAITVLGTAAPAAAHHDHQLHNPSGCHTIPVSHQDHAGATGKKFHGAAHVGPGAAGMARGGQVWVAGNACGVD